MTLVQTLAVHVGAVAIGAWFVPSLGAQQKKNQVQKQNKKAKKQKEEEKNAVLGSIRKIISPSAINCRLRRAERWEYIATVSSEVGKI